MAEKQKQYERERERKIRDRATTSGQNEAKQQKERSRSPQGESSGAHPSREKEREREQEGRDLAKGRTRDGRVTSPRRERDRPSPQRYMCVYTAEMLYVLHTVNGERCEESVDAVFQNP